jgi:autotransporter translocation and assembly factor TamB
VNRVATARRWVIGAAIVIGAAAVVAVGVYELLGSDFFAHGVGRYASRRLFHGTPFTLSIGKLRGNFFGDVRIEGVKIHYAGPAGSFDVFRLEELRCRYSLVSFVEKKPRIEELAVVKPVLRAKADTTGRYVLPFGGGGPSKGFPDLRVGSISIEDGHAIVQGRERSDAVNNLRLRGSVASSRAELSFRIDSASGEDPNRSLVLKRLAGTIVARMDTTVRAGGPGSYRVYFDSLEVDLAQSAIVVTGVFSPSNRFFDCTFSANPLKIGEITSALGLAVAEQGEVEGIFSAQGRPDGFRVRGTMNGVVAGYALSDFKVDLIKRPRDMKIDLMSGYLNGAEIEGSGDYREHSPGVATFNLTIHDLDLSKGFMPGRTLPETNLNGKVAVRYSAAAKEYDFTLDLTAGDFMKFPFTTGTIRGTYKSDTLALKEITLNYPTHSVTARGAIVGDDTVDMTFHVKCKASDMLFKYFNIEEYRADADLDGSWKGTFDRYDLRLAGPVGNFVYHMARIPKGTMALDIKKEESFAVLFDLKAPGCEIGPEEFTGLSVSTDYDGRVTKITNVTLSRENFLATMAGEVTKQGAFNAFRVTELSIDALGEKWTGAGRFEMLLSDTASRFDDIELRSAAGQLRAQGVYRSRAGAVDAELDFAGLSLDLLKRASLVKGPVSGTARGRIACRGSLKDPAVSVDFDLDHGVIDTFAVDSLRLKVEYAARRAVIDSFLVASPSGGLRVGGELSGMTLVDLARHPAETVRAATVSMSASCRNVALPILLSMAGNHTFKAGRFSGIFSLQDSLAHPDFELAGSVAGLTIRSVTIPVIDCNAKLQRGALAVGGVIHVSEGQRGSFRGTIPLAKERLFYALDRSGPLSFELDVPDGDFSRMPDITDLIAEGSGKFSVSFRVTGSVAKPHLRGDFELSKVSCRLSGMEERYSALDARIVLEDSLVTVSSLQGKEGKKGTFTCVGSITLKGWKPARYDLTIDLNQFVAESVPNVLAIVSGKITVGTTVEEGRVLPVIGGSCEVNQSEIYYDLGSMSSPASGETLEPPSFLAAVDLKIPGNTWVKTADARVELKGNVTFYHDEKGNYLRGELDLLRGWYIIYNNKFTIDSGKLQFVEAGGFRPVTDIEAETRDPEGRKIYLTIQWHQDDLQPKLTLRHEDPGYSETDIWKMLGGGIVNPQTGTTWSAAGTAQNLATNYLERVLNAEMQGVTIELESPARTETATTGMLNINETKVAVSKYLSQGLYVKYKQGLSIATAREIDIEYRISDLLLLSSEVIRYSNQVIQQKSTGITEEINVNIQLRWEF